MIATADKQNEAPQARMNPKRTRFAQEYPKDLNATQAAIRAGYSKRTANSIGSELLTIPAIKKAINDRLKKLEEQCSVKVKEILKALRKIAFGEVEPGDKAKDYAARDILKALELLGKTQGLFSDTLKVDIEILKEYTITEQLEAHSLARLSITHQLASVGEAGSLVSDDLNDRSITIKNE